MDATNLAIPVGQALDNMAEAVRAAFCTVVVAFVVWCRKQGLRLWQHKSGNINLRSKCHNLIEKQGFNSILKLQLIRVLHAIEEYADPLLHKEPSEVTPAVGGCGRNGAPELIQPKWFLIVDTGVSSCLAL